MQKKNSVNGAPAPHTRGATLQNIGLASNVKLSTSKGTLIHKGRWMIVVKVKALLQPSESVVGEKTAGSLHPWGRASQLATSAGSA